MEKNPSRRKSAKPLKARSPWVVQNERSDMFHDWVREVRKEVVADAPKRCWGIHRYSQWTALVVDDDDGMNWQTRRCLRCGKIQDTRR